MKSAMRPVESGGGSLVAQPRATPLPPPPPLPPLEVPPLPVVPAVPVVPPWPVEPAVPVEPPLLLLPQPTVDVTLESRKPAPASPRIPKNARILISFMFFLSVRTRSCPPSSQARLGRNPNTNLDRGIEIFSWPGRGGRLHCPALQPLLGNPMSVAVVETMFKE